MRRSFNSTPLLQADKLRSGSGLPGEDRSLADLDKDIETIWRELQQLDRLPPLRRDLTQQDGTSPRPNLAHSSARTLLDTPGWRRRDAPLPATSRGATSRSTSLPPATTRPLASRTTVRVTNSTANSGSSTQMVSVELVMYTG